MRIIPARAGFTNISDLLGSLTRDHPRSRGVYPQLGFGTNITDGSSPLARGLRCVSRAGRRRMGIIPARAGFTFTLAVRARYSADHPRSRGVYAATPRIAARIVGSSPLARGLLIGVFGRGRAARIIPARAGFTGIVSGDDLRYTDHPRSRGVYDERVHRMTQEAGSSPLARGLPALVEAERAARGIIPARAGFTPWGSPRWRPFRDHPRSRGVYVCISGHLTRKIGSSPLARGLLTTVPNYAVIIRIIPARAGFTLNNEHQCPEA